MFEIAINRKPPDASANPVITVWIPLVDASEENGCLHIKPRTHRQRVLEWHRETVTGTGYTVLSEHPLGPSPTVALPVKAGSAILFNDLCTHCPRQTGPRLCGGA